MEIQEIKFNFSLENTIGEENIKNFKRRVLGICGRETTKSIDKLFNILQKVKPSKDKEALKKLIEDLAGKYLIYGNNIFTNMYKCLYFEEEDKYNFRGYRITKRLVSYDKSDNI